MRILSRKWFRMVGSATLALLIVASVLFGLSLRVSVKPEKGFISINARIAQAVQLGGTYGNGEPVSQDVVLPTFGRGGVPITSIDYLDGVHIVFNDPLFQEVIYGKAKMKAKAKGQSLSSLEADIIADIQPYFEVWVLLSSFPAEDPIRNGELASNERIERYQGRDYLVITLAYFGLHLYNANMNQGDFITKVNGLDAGPVIGEWWQ